MHGNLLDISVQTATEVVFTHDTLGLQPDCRITVSRFNRTIISTFLLSRANDVRTNHIQKTAKWRTSQLANLN